MSDQQQSGPLPSVAPLSLVSLQLEFQPTPRRPEELPAYFSSLEDVLQPEFYEPSLVVAALQVLQRDRVHTNPNADIRRNGLRIVRRAVECVHQLALRFAGDIAERSTTITRATVVEAFFLGQELLATFNTSLGKSAGDEDDRSTHMAVITLLNTHFDAEVTAFEQKQHEQQAQTQEQRQALHGRVHDALDSTERSLLRSVYATPASRAAKMAEAIRVRRQLQASRTGRGTNPGMGGSAATSPMTASITETQSTARPVLIGRSPARSSQSTQSSQSSRSKPNSTQSSRSKPSSARSSRTPFDPTEKMPCDLVMASPWLRIASVDGAIPLRAGMVEWLGTDEKAIMAMYDELSTTTAVRDMFDKLRAQEKGERQWTMPPWARLAYERVHRSTYRERTTAENERKNHFVGAPEGTTYRSASYGVIDVSYRGGKPYELCKAGDGIPLVDASEDEKAWAKRVDWAVPTKEELDKLQRVYDSHKIVRDQCCVSAQGGYTTTPAVTFHISRLQTGFFRMFIPHIPHGRDEEHLHPMIVGPCEAMYFDRLLHITCGTADRILVNQICYGADLLGPPSDPSRMQTLGLPVESAGLAPTMILTRARMLAVYSKAQRRALANAEVPPQAMPAAAASPDSDDESDPVKVPSDDEQDADFGPSATPRSVAVESAPSSRQRRACALNRLEDKQEALSKQLDALVERYIDSPWTTWPQDRLHKALYPGHDEVEAHYLFVREICRQICLIRNGNVEFGEGETIPSRAPRHMLGVVMTPTESARFNLYTMGINEALPAEASPLEIYKFARTKANRDAQPRCETDMTMRLGRATFFAKEGYKFPYCCFHATLPIFTPSPRLSKEQKAANALLSNPRSRIAWVVRALQILRENVVPRDPDQATAFGFSIGEVDWSDMSARAMKDIDKDELVAFVQSAVPIDPTAHGVLEVVVLGDAWLNNHLELRVDLAKLHTISTDTTQHTDRALLVEGMAFASFTGLLEKPMRRDTNAIRLMDPAKLMKVNDEDYEGRKAPPPDHMHLHLTLGHHRELPGYGGYAYMVGNTCCDYMGLAEAALTHGVAIPNLPTLRSARKAFGRYGVPMAHLVMRKGWTPAQIEDCSFNRSAFFDEKLKVVRAHIEWGYADGHSLPWNDPQAASAIGKYDEADPDLWGFECRCMSACFGRKSKGVFLDAKKPLIRTSRKGDLPPPEERPIPPPTDPRDQAFQERVEEEPASPPSPSSFASPSDAEVSESSSSEDEQVHSPLLKQRRRT